MRVVIVILIAILLPVQAEGIYDILNVPRDSEPRLVQSAYCKAAFKDREQASEEAT